MSLDRKLKRGEHLADDPAPDLPGVDLVNIHHPDLGVTTVVRRTRLSQMDPAWVVLDPVPDVHPEVGDLKGQALDQALDDAGLPKTGTANEKRARLAEHEAAYPAADSVSVLDAADVTTENKE